MCNMMAPPLGDPLFGERMVGPAEFTLPASDTEELALDECFGAQLEARSTAVSQQ
jgi:hypothetical protein